MCNLLHKNSTSIPKSGVGYKLVSVGENGGVKSYFADSPIYKRKAMEWSDKKHKFYGKKVGKYGFCFFTDIEDLFKYSLNMGYGTILHIAVIHYVGGLGSQKSMNEMGGIRFALCKRYKILSIYRMNNITTV